MEEGRILKSGSSYIYEYLLKDHLGNTRSAFRHTAPTSVTIRSDYYPFGLQYPQNILAGSPQNRYLYNGKELQDGLGIYDYGARLYDPVIGRFGTIDRFAEKYYDMTPYQYGGLNPVKYIDVNGDSLWVTHRTGFLGFGGKETLRYDGGNLYNKDGSAYTGKVKGFLGKTVDALGAINSTQEGGGSNDGIGRFYE